jgi:hypothetical protein
VVGRLATGWNREGLVATHLTLRGPIYDVHVARVPMSTVTPGILRDVLGMSGGGQELEVDDRGEEKTDDAAVQRGRRATGGRPGLQEPRVIGSGAEMAS